MPIPVEPYDEANSLTRPVLFGFLQPQNAPSQPIVSALVTPLVNGVAQKTAPIKPFLVVGLAPVFSAFRFDAAKYVEQLTAPVLDPASVTVSSVFGASDGAPYQAINASCFKDVSIQVAYQYRDSDGLLQTQAATETSAEARVFIGGRNIREVDTSLDSFILANGSPLERFLTNSPAKLSIGRSNSAFLNFISQDFGVNQLAARVRTYNAAGAIIGTGIFNISNNATIEQITIGAGTKELQTQTYATSSGVLDFTNKSVVRYDIQIGLTPAFVPLSELKEYIITECKEVVRIHFLNRLGGADAYSFKDFDTTYTGTEKASVRKKINWGLTQPQYAPNDRGSFNLGGEEKQTITARADITKTEALHLKELISSNEIYIEQDSFLLPAKYDDQQSVIINKKGYTSFEVVLTVAQNAYIQTF